MNPRLSGAAIAAFVLFVFIAGVSLVAIRFSNRELPPFFGAGIRLTVGWLILLLLVARSGRPMPRGPAFLGAVLFGAFSFGLGNVFAYWGLLAVPAGMGQVVLGLVPLLTLFLAFAQRVESLKWQRVAGAMIAVGGIAVVFRDQFAAEVPIPSLLAMVGSAACIAQAGVIAKRVALGHPLVSAAVGTGTGALMLLAISALSGERWSFPTATSTWLALGYLVVSGTVAPILSLFLLNHWSAARTSFQYVLPPFVTVAVAWWLLGEEPTAGFAVGAALVLVGVFLGVLEPQRMGRAP